VISKKWSCQISNKKGTKVSFISVDAISEWEAMEQAKKALLNLSLPYEEWGIDYCEKASTMTARKRQIRMKVISIAKRLYRVRNLYFRNRRAVRVDSILKELEEVINNLKDEKQPEFKLEYLSQQNHRHHWGSLTRR